MSVAFKLLPADNRVPGQFVEVDSSRAVRGPARKTLKALLIGGRLAAGTVAEKVKAAVTSADQARTYFGAGSMLHGMALAWFAQTSRPFDVEMIALADHASGVAATVNLTVAASSASAGTVPLLIAGRVVRAGVAAGDSANTIAATIRSAVNAAEGLPVVASGSGATVTLTANNKGVEGNSIEVRVAYYEGESLPAGVTISGTGVLASGATNPTIDSTLFAAIGDVQYDVIACGFADATNIAALTTEMNRRFGPEVGLQGQVFLAKRDTHGNQTTFGSAQNSPAFVCNGYRNQPMPAWEHAAAIAAVWGGSTQQSPTRPVQNVPVAWLLPGKGVDEWTKLERELLLRNGIATTYTGPGNVVTTERLITFYRLSPAGAPDPAYLDSEILAGISYFRWAWSNRLKLRFPNHKLADDGTRFGAGQDTVTPNVMRAEFAAFYRELEAAGDVEDFDGAMRDSVFERDPADVNRLNMELAVNFTNGFRVGATLLKFRL